MTPLDSNPTRIGPTRVAAILALALVLPIALASCSTSSKTAKRETLAPRLAKLTTTSASSIHGEPLLEPKAVAAFYEARHGEPAWDLPGDANAIRTAIADV